MERRSVLKELLATGPGKAGLVLLVVLSLASLYVIVSYPLDFGPARWSNPAVWADYPRAVPPAWTNLLTPLGAHGGRQQAEHLVLEAREPSDVRAAGPAQLYVYELPFSYGANEPPSFFSFTLGEVVYHARPPALTLALIRPDGLELPLYRTVLRAPRPGEEPPYRRHAEAPMRVLIGSEPQTAEAVAGAFSEAYDADLSPAWLQRRLEAALFGVPTGEAQLEPLRGDYRIEARLALADPRDEIHVVRAVVGGSVYGILGTDALGRDLAEGLLFGLPVALLIGLATSTVSTLIGTTLGLTSGYLGGRTDTLIQRAADIVANVPVLPLLIFMVFILGSRLWLILLILVAFSWPGLTILVRSMVLQLRSSPEVEAARTLGASRAHIIFRHIFPHTAQFVFAQLIFFAPSAILAEAGLSFLGLGDPSLPTWGQILEHGFRTGAVFLGYWWWVVPPGLLIVLTAVTFMLLALGMEPVVNPRLRR
jgi:peptide/nickel transport system permease protein